MKDKDKKVVSESMNIGSVIFLIFLVLKLAEVGQVATWSWWWVTSPLWLPIVAIFITIFIVWVLSKLWEMFNNLK